MLAKRITNCKLPCPNINDGPHSSWILELQKRSKKGIKNLDMLPHATCIYPQEISINLIFVLYVFLQPRSVIYPFSTFKKTNISVANNSIIIIVVIWETTLLKSRFVNQIHIINHDWSDPNIDVTKKTSQSQLLTSFLPQ